MAVDRLMRLSRGEPVSVRTYLEPYVYKANHYWLRRSSRGYDKRRAVTINKVE
jgi:hypothetical protein